MDVILQTNRPTERSTRLLSELSLGLFGRSCASEESDRIRNLVVQSRDALEAATRDGTRWIQPRVSPRSRHAPTVMV